MAGAVATCLFRAAIKVLGTQRLHSAVSKARRRELSSELS